MNNVYCTGLRIIILKINHGTFMSVQDYPGKILKSLQFFFIFSNHIKQELYHL